MRHGVLANGVNGNHVGVANPHLGTLADNGGPLETIALLTGSPAIDGGSNTIPGVAVPTYDERGAERGPGGFNAGPTRRHRRLRGQLVLPRHDHGRRESDTAASSRPSPWANMSFNDNPENLAAERGRRPTRSRSTAINLFSSPQNRSRSRGPLVFTNTTTPEAINGTGVANLTISGGGASQIVKVSTGANVTLGGMTLTGGQAATGGAVDNFGTLNVSGVAFTGNPRPNRRRHPERGGGQLHGQ